MSKKESELLRFEYALGGELEVVAEIALYLQPYSSRVRSRILAYVKDALDYTETKEEKRDG